MISGQPAQLDDICPHGKPLRECPNVWCRGRADDLVHGEFPAKSLEDPESVDEARGERRPKRADTSGGIDLGQLDKITSVQSDKPTDRVDELNRGLVSPTGEPWPYTGRQSPAGVGMCHRCQTWWRGENTCHCTGCHLTFKSRGPFDAHQHWNYRTEPAELRCLAPDELREGGYEPNKRGQWRKPRPEHTLPQKGTE